MSTMSLVVWIGKSTLEAAPESLTRCLESLEISNDVRQGDGMQASFRLHQSQNNDFDLLRDHLVEPFSRMRIGVLQGAIPQILFDGVLTHHQVSTHREKGTYNLMVMGRDLGVMLDLKEKRRTFKNQSDSVIAASILDAYSHLGITQDIRSTPDTPNETDLTRHQYGTDHAFLQMLAARYGNVFYIEPYDTKSSRAYFGPELREGDVLPVLTCDMGHLSNVDSMQFTNNAFQPVTAAATYIDLDKQQSVATANEQTTYSPLAKKPTPPQRQLIAPGSAKQSPERVNIALRALVDKHANAVTADGSVDTIRYGAILRPHRLIDVRGVGASYSGRYYIQRVSHSIQRQRYTQSFSLSREGTGAAAKVMS